MVVHGQPCIKGTRIMVSVILGELSAGTSFDEVIEAYPRVTSDDILACLAFAAELTESYPDSIFT